MTRHCSLTLCQSLCMYVSYGGWGGVGGGVGGTSGVCGYIFFILLHLIFSGGNVQNWCERVICS